MTRLFKMFGHSEQRKIAQKVTKKFAKAGSKFCQILTNPLTTIAKWLNFAKSGHTCTEMCRT